MSRDLYEVLALSARYLFALLGVLIALRAFFWLLTAHAEKKQRLRRLPAAGTVGEFVVLSGGDLRPGDAILVPWEGVLGSVRSCDVFVPGQEIRRRHLSFSFQPGQGLLVRPFSGCEALVNAEPVNCHSRPESFPLRHGSFLQLGDVTLRLRLFAGLDPQAGFGEDDGNTQVQQMPQNGYLPEQTYMPNPVDMQQITLTSPQVPDSVPFAPVPSHVMEPVSCPGYLSGGNMNVPPNADSPEPKWISQQPPLPSDADTSTPDQVFNPAGEPSESPARRRRRSDRWEVDWSE